MQTENQLLPEEQPAAPAADVTSYYDMAAVQLFDHKLSPEEVIANLEERGIPNEQAAAIVFDLQGQFSKLKKERAQKDMLWGAIWCVGGIVLTMANIGFIFWGAIVFGGIQFIRGVANAGD